MCQAQILAVSASFVCYERALSLSLNGAINTKALGTSCYYDSSILFQIYYQVMFPQDLGLMYIQKFLNFSVHSDHLGNLAEDDFQANSLQMRVYFNSILTGQFNIELKYTLIKAFNSMPFFLTFGVMQKLSPLSLPPTSKHLVLWVPWHGFVGQV